MAMSVTAEQTAGQKQNQRLTSIFENNFLSPDHSNTSKKKDNAKSFVVITRVEILAEISLRERRVGGKKIAKPPVIRRKISAVTGVSWKNNSDYSRFLGNFRR